MTGRTALVIVVTVAEPLVGEVRARYDPVAAHGMPPHVTVLYPFVPPPPSDDDILSLEGNTLRGVGDSMWDGAPSEFLIDVANGVPLRPV